MTDLLPTRTQAATQAHAHYNELPADLKGLVPVALCYDCGMRNIYTPNINALCDCCQAELDEWEADREAEAHYMGEAEEGLYRTHDGYGYGHPVGTQQPTCGSTYVDDVLPF